MICNALQAGVPDCSACSWRTTTASVRNDMRVASLIARYLLGLIFLVFGLNGFFHFIPMPPATGTAGQFMGAMFVSHYLVVVFLLQVIPAILLLINRYVPLALTLLAPVIVNIFLFHAVTWRRLDCRWRSST